MTIKPFKPKYSETFLCFVGILWWRKISKMMGYDCRIVRNIMLLLLLLKTSHCYPLELPTGDFKPEIKDEVRFPNGTVVGKYAYTDEEGNPIHVKYYANADCYGVELNSVKIVDATTSSALTTNFEDTSQNITKKEKTSPDDLFMEPNTQQYTKETSKSEFEPFFENDLVTSNSINKEKIRIYNFEKNKRKIRSNYDVSDVSDICSQF